MSGAHSPGRELRQAGTFRGVIPFVSDHKTTSDFRYAKTAADLRKDPQGIIYAMAVMDHYKSDQADLIWTYMLTKGARKAKRVHLRVLREDVEIEFAKIELTASEIVATHLAQPSPLTLPPNTSACSAYGGCPYRGNCTDLSTVNTQGKKMSQATEDFLNSMTQQMPASERPVPAADTATGTAASDFALPDWMTADKDPLTVKTTTTILPPPLDQVLINPPGEAEAPSASLLPRPPPPVVKPAGARAKRRTKEEMAAARAVAPNTSTVLETYNDTTEAPTLPAPASVLAQQNADIFYTVLREVVRDVVQEVLAERAAQS